MKKKTKSSSTVLEKFDEIESKQNKLFDAINRAQAKLNNAVKINAKIRDKLQKSRELQERFIETTKNNPAVSSFLNELFDKVLYT